MDVLEFPELPTPVRAVRSRRARRFTLNVSRADGAVRLTAPPHSCAADMRRFVLQHAGWIEATLRAAPPAVPVRPGSTIPFEGAPRRIVSGGFRRGPPRLLGEDRIAVAGTCPDAAARALKVWLRQAARTRLSAAASRYAGLLGATAGPIAIRDTKSRWGSCSAAGRLSFSWRLILAPPEVLDYVAAHESAHLREMNHGPRFWAHLATAMPDFAARRAWLRAHGADLHRYRLA